MVERIFVVTDIETDGPAPGPNSMIAFASVAVTAAGRQIDEFEAVLEPLPHAQPDPGTSAWWATQPLEVQEAARTNPRLAVTPTSSLAWCRSLRRGASPDRPCREARRSR